MKPPSAAKLVDGASCLVIGGTHAGKAGVVRDIKTSKTGHVTVTLVQSSGERFKTLAKNVQVQDIEVRKRVTPNQRPSER